MYFYNIELKSQDVFRNPKFLFYNSLLYLKSKGITQRDQSSRKTPVSLCAFVFSFSKGNRKYVSAGRITRIQLTSFQPNCVFAVARKRGLVETRALQFILSKTDKNERANSLTASKQNLKNFPQIPFVQLLHLKNKSSIIIGL